MTQDKAEDAENQEPEQDQQTPFERFVDFARRIVQVPKSEIPKDKWSKKHSSDDVH